MAEIDKEEWSGEQDLEATFFFRIDVISAICDDLSQTYITFDSALESNIETFLLGSGLVHESWYSTFFESS